MTLQESDLQALTERLGKLEKSNCRMRQMGLVALVLAAAVLLMGQAAPRRTVEANEFILRDANGKVRGKLEAETGGPRLTLYDANGKTVAALSEGGGGVGVKVLGPNLSLFSAKGDVLLALDSDGPFLQISDMQRFRTHIGTTGLVIPSTGQSRLTSAASIVLFDKDGKMIWQAP